MHIQNHYAKMLNLLKIKDLFILIVVDILLQLLPVFAPCIFSNFNLSQRVSHYPYNIRTKFILHINKTNKKLSGIALRNVLPKLINEIP